MKSKKIELHPEVKRFLDDVCKHIPDAKNKIEVREEILSHLEAELEDVNEDFEANIKKALEKFGDPLLLGRSLYVARRTWPQKMITYGATCALLVFSVLYLSSYYFINHYQELLQKTNDVVATRIPRFEAEQKEIASLNLWTESSNLKADAGAYLNSRVLWSGANAFVEIQVPEVLDSSWNNEWLSADIPLPLTKLDLSWVKKLQSYDHWDLFKSGPNARLIGKKPELISPYSFPIPEFSFLSRAARLHLRRALDSGDVISAFVEVRHLARLVYTTETLVGSMTAVNLLKIERAAYDEAIKKNLVVPNGYVPLAYEAIEKMKTTLWVTAGFADYAAPAVMAEVFLAQDSPWPVGSCAALAETAQAVVLTSEFLKKKYPFEMDLSQQTNVTNKVFEASRTRCRLVFHRQLISRTKEYADFMVGFTKSADWWNYFANYQYTFGRHLPFVRQGIGLQLMTVAWPNFSGRYEHE